MPRWPGLGLLLVAGLGGAVWAQGVGPFDGQYVGAMTLTRWVGGDCTDPPLGARYPLSIAGGQVRFKYVPRFDTVLRGTVDRNGNFKASARIHHGTVVMTGHVQGGDLTAEIVSPSCHYSYSTRN